MLEKVVRAHHRMRGAFYRFPEPGTSMLMNSADLRELMLLPPNSALGTWAMPRYGNLILMGIEVTGDTSVERGTVAYLPRPVTYAGQATLDNKIISTYVVSERVTVVLE